MKKRLDQTLLASLILGAAGLLLNLAVVLHGHEANGLAKHGYLPAMALPAVALAGIALPVIRFWGISEKRKYLQVFTASAPAAAALLGAALGVVVTSLLDLPRKQDMLDLGRCLTGIASGPALALCAWARLKGKRPVWLCWAVVATHLVLLLLSSYPHWSRQAEFNAYAYQLLACLSLLLAAYQQAAADGGMGNLKEYAVVSLFCVALCPIAMIGSEHWMFYFTLWLYHTVNLRSLKGV